MAFTILALTVSLSLSRPSLGRFRIRHSEAAIIGAALTILLGLIPPPMVVFALRLLFFPVITIISLMTITLIAEQSGLFELLANRIAIAAGGNPRKLFSYIFFTGTITGTFFTNDAAVLIFTPLVFQLIEEVKDETWKPEHKVPFYFAVLYVANLVGALVISNPINIVVSSIFEIRFLYYAKWMVLPAIVSILVSYSGLRYYFRKQFPQSYRLQAIVPKTHNSRFLKISAGVLAITLIGFFSESTTGIPIWAVALSGALLLMILHKIMNQKKTMEIVRGIGWDVIVFVIGIFIVAIGLRNAGLTKQVVDMINWVSGENFVGRLYATGFTAAFFSSLMNNHPTVDMMTWVVRDFSLDHFQSQKMAFAVLIGGDLGPKMLPIGSLAALIWFRILRTKGVDIPYSLYIRIGIPVTLSAILCSLLVLNLEILLVQLFQ